MRTGHAYASTGSEIKIEIPSPPSYPKCMDKGCDGTLLPLTEPAKYRNVMGMVLVDTGSSELYWKCSKCGREIK
jgi:hypothetical protein